MKLRHITTHNFINIGVILLSLLFAASIATATEGVNTNRALKYTKHVNKKEKGRTTKNPKTSKGNKKSKKLNKIVKIQETDQVPIHCQLPGETGRCEAYFIRWFFNTASQKCETFVYGGCEGNKNNFHTEKECSISCDRKIEDEYPKDQVYCLLSCASVRCQFGLCVESCPFINTNLVTSKDNTYCTDSVTNKFVGCAVPKCIPEKTKEQCNISCANVRCASNPCVESCPDPLTNIVKNKGNTYCTNTLTNEFAGCVEIKCAETSLPGIV